VITTDMGMDDLLAIYILLRDPSVDIRAIAVDATGLVHCGPGLRNIRRILDVFGRSDVPFACGRDAAGPDGVPFPDDWRAGADDMYGVVLPPVVGTDLPPEGAALLADAIDAAPAPATIVALGTWTVLEDLFAARPDLLASVAGIHAMAGAIDVPGNMSAGGILQSDGVEWNVGADPSAVSAVFALDIPVTLVPLDATDDVPVPADVVAQLTADHAAAGADIALETYARAPWLATPGNFWWDTTAAAALVDPSLVSWEDTAVSVSDIGRIARDPSGRPARIATGADGERAQAAILAGLRRGPGRPDPFTIGGTIRVTWDGSSCTIDADAPTSAGPATIELVNTSSVPAGLFGAGIAPGHTWDEAVAFMHEADLGDESLVIPDWIRPVEGAGPYAEPGATASALTTLPAPIVGFACGTGDWPDVTFIDGGSITLSE
jgi:inosine-uridine nucleoside N-ribohydrolase